MINLDCAVVSAVGYIINNITEIPPPVIFIELIYKILSVLHNISVNPSINNESLLFLLLKPIIYLI